MAGEDVYDYVVIGGGSAGSVIASRLSKATAKVLLLEAGGTDRRPDVLIPAGVASAYERCNWKYPTEPDRSRGDRPEAWMAGKVLGGGGSINSCVFVRGHRADYDGWAKAGCTGWDYDSVLPSFKRIETWEGGADHYRGGDGPISVVVQSNRGQANMTYMRAAEQAGYERTEDYNGATPEGIALVQVNMRRGIRSQASREYIRRVADKAHLTVKTKAQAERILFEGRQAVSVQYRSGGEIHTVRVREEVILSAGTLSSPKTLMLSGVGPAPELNRFNIGVVADVPGVGRNLHEHPYLMQRWRSRIPTMNKMRLKTLAGGLYEYARHGTGMLAMTMVQVQVMTRTSPSVPASDLQLQFVPMAITRDVDENGMFNVQMAKEEGFLSSSTFLHPRARGEIRLRSSSPADPPVIDYQFLADPDDLRDTLAGLRAVQEIMAQPAMLEIVDGQFEPERSCRSESDWEAYVRATVTPSYHPVGTCKMGVDDHAVVDPELRVRGVQGLRVADASVMPAVTSGNTNAPTMMIGERASELILGSALT